MRSPVLVTRTAHHPRMDNSPQSVDWPFDVTSTAAAANSRSWSSWESDDGSTDHYGCRSSCGDQYASFSQQPALCENWAAGYCRFGDRCSFSHGNATAHATGLAFLNGATPTGGCDFSAETSFATLPPLPPEPSAPDLQESQQGFAVMPPLPPEPPPPLWMPPLPPEPGHGLQTGAPAALAGVVLLSAPMEHSSAGQHWMPPLPPLPDVAVYEECALAALSESCWTWRVFVPLAHTWDYSCADARPAPT